jgi:secreted trypsin-like serine protease
MQNASNCVLEISVEWERRIRMAITASVLSMVLNGSAFAIVGASKEILDANKQPEVMIVGDRGNFCAGTLIAQDVVLTAAHCVLPGANYMLLGFA